MDADTSMLKLYHMIQQIDDGLGAFSDYEGDEGGPTWHAWNQGYVIRRAEEAMALHGRAVLVSSPYPALRAQIRNSVRRAIRC